MLETIKPSILVLIKDLGMIFQKETSTKKERFGIYKCQCGKEFNTRVSEVKRGKTVSCGCYQKATAKNQMLSHGLTNHRLYSTWNNIIKRTTDITNKSYNRYGGRGIKVCDRWLDINNFIEDMYPSYEEGLTIDRIDNNKGYYPINCRWATMTVQAQNTRAIRANNTSGYRGVSWHNINKKWISGIRVNKKNKYLGTFNTALEAAKTYDEYVITNGLEHTINGV